MAFDVNPAKLDGYGKALSDLAGQTGAAKNYLGTHLNLSMWEKGLVGQGIWAVVINRMGEAVQAISANLDSLNTLSAGSAEELTKTADMYRHTDRTNAKRLDDTY